jgi:hypothetical protein
MISKEKERTKELQQQLTKAQTDLISVKDDIQTIKLSIQRCKEEEVQGTSPLYYKLRRSLKNVRKS